MEKVLFTSIHFLHFFSGMLLYPLLEERTESDRRFHVTRRILDNPEACTFAIKDMLHPIYYLKYVLVSYAVRRQLSRTYGLFIHVNPDKKWTFC